MSFRRKTKEKRFFFHLYQIIMKRKKRVILVYFVDHEDFVAAQRNKQIVRPQKK